MLEFPAAAALLHNLSGIRNCCFSIAEIHLSWVIAHPDR